MQAQPGRDDLAAYYFHQGTDCSAYTHLGVHALPMPGGWRYTFRTWASRAERVEVAGDFNDWGSLPMSRSTSGGLWEAIFDSAEPLTGARYKFRVISKAGVFLKADPYAREAEWGMKTASIIPDDTPYLWGDRDWLRRRGIPLASPDGFYPAPMNIYEMHPGSWMTRNGASTAENGDAYLNYRELADELVPYLRQMGYTHVELMPIAEYPDDVSWGYGVCGYFAPTSRFGSPADFRYLVDRLHQNNIGIILDWVPAYFSRHAHGLCCFDGYPMYEYSGQEGVDFAAGIGCCFDIGRPEVQTFLISCALYWLREFHIDGLRTHALAAMLYPDHDRRPGERMPDGNGCNPDAIAFVKKLNTRVLAEFPDVLMIAEDFSSPVQLTQPVSAGGLGFNFKWNMGWSNDMLDYISTDPVYRRYKHEKLTFSMMYAFAEHYILPVPHDLLTHGQKALLDKMYGDYTEKFAAMRTLLAYQIAHPGKKLLFMGSEYGQFREWDFAYQLEWFMTDYAMHRRLQEYVAALNRFYLDTPALWEIDDNWAGFGWLEADDRTNNVVALRRFDRRGGELIVILNFGPILREGYTVRIPDGKPAYSPVFSTDAACYGGSGRVPADCIEAVINGDDCTLTLDLPPYSALFLVPNASTVTLPHVALR